MAQNGNYSWRNYHRKTCRKNAIFLPQNIFFDLKKYCLACIHNKNVRILYRKGLQLLVKIPIVESFLFLKEQNFPDYIQELWQILFLFENDDILTLHVELMQKQYLVCEHRF